MSAEVSDLATTVVPDPESACAAGLSLAFGRCRGFVHTAPGQTGVVLCSPWGFEDLVMRKAWRLLAEGIAAAGFPCLRFDYPGTGDSLGAMNDVADVETWVQAIGQAADTLRKTSGVRRFVFIGQSLGAALAVLAARRRGDVAGLQLIAPVVKGRAYARELGVTAAMVAERMGIAVEADASVGLSVVGFTLSPAMVASIKALDMMAPAEVPAASVTIFDQDDRKAVAELTEHLRRQGAAVTWTPVGRYQLMVSDAVEVQPLPVTTEAVVSALRALAPVDAALPVPALPALAGALSTERFREEVIRFGSSGHLFGLMCRPTEPMPDAPTVILLNRGINSHIGWNRSSVEAARALAAAGVTSLRMDLAGLGESADEPGRPPNLIYSDLLVPDISAAIDAVAAVRPGRVMLAGVCSGAYMALTAAAADPRVTDVVAVNTQRLVWNPREDVEDVIRYGLRSMSDYVGDIRAGGILRKLVRSRRRIVPAMRFLVAGKIKSAAARVPLGVRAVMMRGSMAARVNRLFDAFERRGTAIALVYSRGDPGLRELASYFGADGHSLRRENVFVSFLEGADHNLTTAASTASFVEILIARSGTAASHGGSAAARRHPDAVGPRTTRATPSLSRAP